MDKKIKHSISSLLLAIILLFNTLSPALAELVRPEDIVNYIASQVKLQNTKVKVDIDGDYIVEDSDKMLNDIYKNVQDSILLTAFEGQNIFGMNMNTAYYHMPNSNGKNIKNINLDIKYKNSSSDVKYAKSYVKEKAKDWKNLSEYDQLRNAYDDVLKAFYYKQYDVTGTNEALVIKERNLKSGLEGGGIVCDGYTMLLSLYFDELGFENKVVLATMTDDMSYGAKHAWNIVKTSQGWYHCDSTWGDNKGMEDRYFLMTEKKSQDQRAYTYDNLVPKATSKAYVKLEKSSVDKSGLADLLKRYNELDRKLYTEESLRYLDLNMNIVKSLINNNAANKEIIDDTLKKAEKAMRELVKKEKSEADRSAYNKLVEKYSKIDKSKYTADSLNRLELKKIESDQKLKKTNISQKEVDEITKDLENVFNQLILKGNTSNLEKLIKDSKLIDESLYTRESVALLRKAISDAETALLNKDINQKEIDKQVANLSYAKDNLKTKLKLNKEDLKKVIEKYEALDKSLYTGNSLHKLEVKVGEGRLLLVKNDIKQSDIDDLVHEINSLIARLEKRIDTSKLKTLLDTCKKIDYSKYTNETAKALLIAIENGELGLRNTNISQVELEILINNLELAKSRLKIKDYVSTLDKSKLKKVIDRYLELDKSIYTEASAYDLEYRIEEAKEILLSDKIDQVDIDLAVDNANIAFEKLVIRGNIEYLRHMVEELSRLNEKDYTDVSFRPFSLALRNAKKGIESPNITDIEVTNLINNLMAAKNVLIAVNGNVVDIPLSEKLKKIKEGTKNLVYISGYEDNTFKGKKNMTRLEAVRVLSTLLSYTDVDTSSININFKDSKNIRWGHEDIKRALAMKLVSGYQDGTFKPNKNITRAEAVTMLVNFTGVDKVKTNLPKDARKHWAKDNIATAMRYGWVSGYPDGTFRPDKNITRAEFITIVNGIIDRKVNIDFISEEEQTKFTDVKGEWYFKQVLAAIYPNRY